MIDTIEQSEKIKHIGTFCKFNDMNLEILSENFKISKVKRGLTEYRNIYITSDLELALTSLTREELIKLNLREMNIDSLI